MPRDSKSERKLTRRPLPSVKKSKRPSTPKCNKRKRGNVVPVPNPGTTKEKFHALCPCKGNVVPTFMRRYLIHLVKTEGLPLMRVFRGLDHKNYYTWSAIAASKEDGSPSPPPKKKLQGRPRIHSAVDVRRIGEQMATGQLPSSGRRAAADLNISNRTLRRIIGERQEELGLRPVTRKRRTKLSVDKN